MLTVIDMAKKGQAIRTLILFIIALLVLFLIFYFISKNTQQSFSLVEQIKEMFG